MILSTITNWYEELTHILFISLLLNILNKLGKGLVLRESIAFFYCLTCLEFPVLGYNVYTGDFWLSRLFMKYMLVPEAEYLSMALPAISAFVVALTWPLPANDQSNDEGQGIHNLFLAIKARAIALQSIAIWIIVVGIIFSVISRVLPASLSFVATLFFFSAFAGLLYLYFCPPSMFRTLFIIIFLVFVAGNALSSGMFTVVAYMGITIFSFFFLGNRMSLVKKVSIFSIGVMFILVLQSSKGAYREATWFGQTNDNRALVFAKLFWENLQKGTSLFKKEEFYPLHVRMNQGWNITLVMKRIPAMQEPDGGKQLVTVAAASFVPRLLWPDKPMAGGKFNMKHYAGVTISGYSTNVGPLGEGYGSFGKTGAMFFMAILGLFIRWVYKRFFSLAIKYPLLICWLPVMFYQLTYSAETDTLQILNSLIKGSFFIWFLMKVMPAWFGIKKQQGINRVLNNDLPYLQKG
ncbi:hypothetical protein [Flavihumibacter fluvii]|uniref:hypothetical protein n=1 Tax=Flavihumibacter fluvii TaxID=2838157 RepID=UPI001BDE7B4D|nr:hypothetical protein [Flavihumibacter fluvii]ULQ52402.1 hypothetical protein KJS93_20145 [Flavihumibacter fluvii]